MQKIMPCLWFDNEAEPAAKFYTSIFKNSKILEIAPYTVETPSNKKIGSVMTVVFKINGQKFMGLNGGTFFKANPSVSFFVNCKTKAEVDSLYNKLSKNGEVMMALDKYPFSERYAFIKDKFGVSWQIMLSKGKQVITPCFLFVGKDIGKAEAAIKLYTKVFKKGKINTMMKYGNNQGGKPGTVMNSTFSIEGQGFMAMDGMGPHKFAFNEATSFIIECKDQKEIDYFYGKLSAVKQAEICGWLKDKFGISWQVVTPHFEKLMRGKNAKKVMQAVLEMKRINIKKLEQAAKN